MKHTFTDDQIHAAKHLAASRMNRDWISRFNVKDIRAFLDALPEPATDDWQECRFEDIRKGDRVKRVRIYDSGTTDIRKGVVANEDIHFASCTQKSILVSAEDLNSLIVKLYRIPAPVQHPDPDVHKYILDVDGDLWIWSKSQRKYIEPETLVQSAPAEFDEWSPAKVVEDDR